MFALITITPDWVTAGSTIVLAIVAFVAIFQNQIQERIRHPEFAVHFQPSPPDCNCIPTTYWIPGGVRDISLSAHAHYVRVRVENSGNAGAENVEVSVVAVRSTGKADPSFQPIQMSTPWNFTWKDIQSDFLPRLPVGSERHFDIGHVVDPKRRSQIQGEDKPGSDPSKTLFCLAFFVKSNTLEYLLDPGKYEIDFKVFSANAKPSPVFTFRLTHSGNWYPDEERMYRDGLKMSIKNLRRA